MNAKKLLGYSVAGAVLLILSDTVPELAIPTAGLILLASALKNTEQIKKLAEWIKNSTG